MLHIFTKEFFNKKFASFVFLYDLLKKKISNIIRFSILRKSHRQLNYFNLKLFLSLSTFTSIHLIP